MEQNYNNKEIDLDPILLRFFRGIGIFFNKKGLKKIKEVIVLFRDLTEYLKRLGAENNDKNN